MIFLYLAIEVTKYKNREWMRAHEAFADITMCIDRKVKYFQSGSYFIRNFKVELDNVLLMSNNGKHNKDVTKDNGVNDEVIGSEANDRIIHLLVVILPTITTID